MFLTEGQSADSVSLNKSSSPRDTFTTRRRQAPHGKCPTRRIKSSTTQQNPAHSLVLARVRLRLRPVNDPNRVSNSSIQAVCIYIHSPHWVGASQSLDQEPSEGVNPPLLSTHRLGLWEETGKLGENADVEAENSPSCSTLGAPFEHTLLKGTSAVL